MSERFCVHEQDILLLEELLADAVLVPGLGSLPPPGTAHELCWNKQL